MGVRKGEAVEGTLLLKSATETIRTNRRKTGWMVVIGGIASRLEPRLHPKNEEGKRNS